ncbi:MAG TPA: diacylglycerol kinase family protein, partial [Gaiellaceae bacterium]|nr:diacylglycerol kinase family protein [Gaiellaceae bacterium]
AAALAHDLPFVCIPAGTRNHFALDLGLDRDDPVGALDAFENDVERLVDVAEVNGRLFLNNVSIGVYGEAVRRSGYRDAKARTLLETVLGPSGSARGVDVVDDRGRQHRDPAVVLVSNNPYSLEPPRPPGTRAALDSGKLGILVLDPPSAVRAWVVPSLQVNASAPVHVGIDGEAVTLESPLLFEILPRALRVLVP